MFIVRSEIFREDRRGSVPVLAPTASLVLQAIDEPGTGLRFDSFVRRDQARAAAGELYQLLFGVMGSLDVSPTHAACAEWDLGHPTEAEAFERLYQQLAELRRQLLPTLVFDWLLKRLDHEGQYLTLSLYADEAGLELGQSHPEIRRFTAHHSPSTVTATSPFGARYYRVARRDPLARPPRR